MRRRDRSSFWRVPVNREVNEELEQHIELQVRRYMQEGMTEADARARAADRFGDRARIEDECRDIRTDMEADMRRSEFLDELRQDVLFAFRGFRRNPLFTAVAMLTIAIGVGANTTIFSVVNTVLLQPLPYANGARNVVLFNSYNQQGLDHTSLAAGELFDMQETMRSLGGIAGVRPVAATLTADGSDPAPLSAYQVTPNLFEVIGATPELGRTFLPDDGAPATAQVAVLSHSLWIQRFAGDPAIIGKQIVVNSIPREVIGVMRDGMRFPDMPVDYATEKADIWLPSTFLAQRVPQNRGNQFLVAVGYLRPGATQADLNNDLAAVSARFKREFPDRYASPTAKGWHPVAVTLRDEMVGSVRPALLMLTTAVGLLLLIACVNVANLLLARTALRQRELAVRLALGAGRLRLLRQLIAESVVLALMGGVLGVALSWAGIRALRTFGTVELPSLEGTRIDLTVLSFSFLISLLAGVIVGLVPAWQQGAANIRDTLGEGSRGASGGLARRRLRSALVIAQVAMALMILNGAGLLTRSFRSLQSVDTGVKAAGVMTAQLALPGRQYDSLYKINAFATQLQSKLAQMPGVTSASGIYPLPMADDGWSGSFDVEDLPPDSKVGPHAQYAAVLPGYFRTMGMSLRGRDFTSDDFRDDTHDRPRVAIIDEDLAKKYWPKQDAIGKRISRDRDTSPWLTIVGVVTHVWRDGPTKPSEPQIYLSYLQYPQARYYPVVKTSRDPLTLAAPMREAVHSLDRNLPVAKQRSMADLEHASLARQRFNLVMIAIFAAAALTLAAIGLYGVMAYLVAQRTREIGIRVALGGQPSDVRSLVVRESLWIAAIGVAIGITGTVAASSTLSDLLYGISATDPVTYAVIAGMLLLVALGAAFGPARRATRVDPLVALRE
jgi:predicted permease